jgi:hypothetical protein
MAFPGIRAAWKLSNGQFGQEFRNFVDAILERVPAAGNADAYSEWRSLVQSAKIASVPIL